MIRKVVNLKYFLQDNECLRDFQEKKCSLKDFLKKAVIPKVPVQALCEHLLTSFDISEETCPFCGSKELHRLEDYDRDLIVLNADEKLEAVSVILPRVICIHCKKSHVVFLSPSIVPFSFHSLSAILWILQQFFNRTGSAEQFFASNDYFIGKTTVYKWVRLLEEDGQEWLSCMYDLSRECDETDEEQPSDEEPADPACDQVSSEDLFSNELIITLLSTADRFADAFDRFLIRTLRSPFQTHSNPATCSSAPPGGLVTSPHLEIQPGFF